MDKETFLTYIKSAREEWDTLLAKIELKKMSKQALSGGCSLKDIIAHITWYEREMITLINSRLLTGSPLWLLPHDQRNLAIIEENRERPLTDVITEAETTYHAFLEAVSTLTTAELNDAFYFKEMPSDWIPWQIIADSAYNHYHHHMPEIKAKLIA
jgi:hypothetical protein